MTETEVAEALRGAPFVAWDAGVFGKQRRTVESASYLGSFCGRDLYRIAANDGRTYRAWVKLAAVSYPHRSYFEPPPMTIDQPTYRWRISTDSPELMQYAVAARPHQEDDTPE